MSKTYQLEKPALEYISLDYVRATHAAIRPYIVRTPVLTFDYFDKTVSEAVGHDVKFYFKPELLQRTGAFKVRGALNAVMGAKAKSNCPGVVTHSSGNHGAATAYAAKVLGVKATIVVPNFATEAKCSNIAQYGAEIIKVDAQRGIGALKDKVVEVMNERGYEIVYPYNQKETVAGQATISVELIEDTPQMDAILVPVSGGGLISGVAVGAKHLNPNIKTFGVSPKAKTLATALSSGIVPDHWSPTTFVETDCDALKAHPGDITFPIMCELLEKQVFDFEDPEAAAAMKLAWQRMKLTLELSSSPVIHTLLSSEFAKVAKEQNLRHVGVVLSGGNTDVDGKMPWDVYKR